MAVQLQVGVKVLLQNADGKYLLLRRNGEKYPEAADQWDIPGGRIDPGSTLMDNLKREVEEEAGLSVSNVRLVAAQDLFRLPERHTVRLTYTGRADGEPRLSEEHSEYLWFTKEELVTLENLDSYFKELLTSGAIH